MPTLAPNPVSAVAVSLTEIRRTAPLVHNITNYVVMNNTANALLAVGASPAMVHAADEVEEFVAISRALVVNIGTLSPPWVGAMRIAAERARARRVPWALDPVGVGATTFRDAVASVVDRAPAVVVVDLVADGAREGEVLIGLLEAMSPRVPLITLSHDDLPHTAGDVDLDVRCDAPEEIGIAVASLGAPSRDALSPVLH
jgi:hypothetical protein